MKKNNDAFYWIAAVAGSVVGSNVSVDVYDKVWAKMFKKTNNLLATSIVSVSAGIVSGVAAFCVCGAILEKGIKIVKR